MVLKDLKQLLKVLQEYGVTDYQSADLTLKLEARAPSVDISTSDATRVPTDRELTPEELLFYSAPRDPDQMSES